MTADGQAAAPGPRLSSDDALADALVALRAADPGTLGPAIDRVGRPALRLRAPGFAGLAAIVTGQQLSTASAAAILGRVQALLNPFDAAAVSATDDAALRACGLSAGKVRTLRAMAAAVQNGTLSFAALERMTAEAAHAALVAVPGIGPWTADVFLLFCLGHPDTWPAGDLALQEAVRLILGAERRPGVAEMTAIGDRWRPNRGAAAYVLWGYYRLAKRREGVMPAVIPGTG